MTPDIKQTLSRAKDLIDRKQYQQALTLLADVDHPTAQKWRQQLKKRLKRANTNTIFSLSQTRKLKKAPPEPDSEKVGPVLMSVLVLVAMLSGGLMLMALSGSPVQPEPAQLVIATEPATAPIVTPLPTNTSRPPVVRSSLRGQTYQYQLSSPGRNSSSNSSSASSGSNWSCTGDLYNCSLSDFSSEAEMRDYFRSCPGDPSNLDGNSDGIPCEDGLS